ncbi:MAG: hypothetical protein JKX84_00645 [Flavobacteriales bacterium]|nr:hypothetical protein [Flavobacteriales bacterium]
MKTAICTISSEGHLFKTKALFHSLSSLTDAAFHCLITDSDAEQELGDRIGQVQLSELNSATAQTIKGKYLEDKLRWACKPLLLLYLLEKEYDSVIYVDNDIYFYGSPDFLFEMLVDHSVLLTPHFYNADPTEKQHWLEANFRIGLYNAGFIAASQSGKDALKWWGNCCAYNVKQSSWRGLFDDQRYLDMLPILSDDVHVLKHRGCNVASWNVDQNPRSLNQQGNIILGEKWPLIFIHFNGFTMRAIGKGQDEMLRPHLNAYFANLKEYNPNFTTNIITKYGLSDVLNYLRYLWWMLIRKMD